MFPATSTMGLREAGNCLQGDNWCQGPVRRASSFREQVAQGGAHSGAIGRDEITPAIGGPAPPLGEQFVERSRECSGGPERTGHACQLEQTRDDSRKARRQVAGADDDHAREGNREDHADTHPGPWQSSC